MLYDLLAPGVAYFGFPVKSRVLLIEDNEVNRYLATFLLRREGLEVIHALNGREGVERARADLPEVIVMDIEMPEMDGYEAARLLLQMTETRHLPIVASTSYAMPGERAKALAMGFADYIEKPYDPADFVARILRCLPLSHP